jgi:hypothetical protein
MHVVPEFASPIVDDATCGDGGGYPLYDAVQSYLTPVVFFGYLGVWRIAGLSAMMNVTANNRILSVRRRSILLFNSSWHSMLRYPPLFLQDYLS